MNAEITDKTGNIEGVPFWLLRLIAATFVFDLGPYLTNVYRRVGYGAINVVFAYLPLVYLLAAWKGARP